MDRTLRSVVPVLTLAMLGLLSCDVRVASTLAPVAAVVAAAPAPAPDAEVEAVLAHLTRNARRTGLTEREMRTLSRTIVTEARRHRLDPRLVLAVVHVESRYDTYAVSDKQAMGLMQMLPSTGEWLAAQVGVGWQGPQTLFDPISNVRLGVAYLRMLLDRYDGTPLPADYADLVLRAYGRHT